MSVTCRFACQPVPEERFKEVDYAVMGCAFRCQNDLGRLCDEEIYQNDLASRIAAAGIGSTETEVPLSVKWRGFVKDYYLDLLVLNGIVYELKAVTTLGARHQSQVLNYLILLGLNHGKLINFRHVKLESRYVSTRLTPENSRQVVIDQSRWQSPNEACQSFCDAFCELLRVVGPFLELPFYQEAMTWFLGGEEKVLQQVRLQRDGIPLGQQKFRLIEPETSFLITSVAEEDSGKYEAQLRRLLSLTELRSMAWVNLDHHTATFTTLKR